MQHVVSKWRALPFRWSLLLTVLVALALLSFNDVTGVVDRKPAANEDSSSIRIAVPPVGKAQRRLQEDVNQPAAPCQLIAVARQRLRSLVSAHLRERLRLPSAVPDILRPLPRCPGPFVESQAWPIMRFWLLCAVFVCGFLAFGTTAFLAVVALIRVIACFIVHGTTPAEFARSHVLKILGSRLLILVVACLAGIKAVSAASLYIPTTVLVLQEWEQYIHCRWPNLAPAPTSWFPTFAGAKLAPAEQSIRAHYFITILVAMIFFAYIFGHIISMCAACCSKHHVRPSTASQQIGYHQVPTRHVSVNRPMPPARPSHCCVLVVMITFQFFCALLSLGSAALNLMNINAGICWELYVMWAAVVLTGTLLAAMLRACQHGTLYCQRQAVQGQAAFPNLALPIVQPVLPIIGEPLDTFKDWLFVGLATSTGTWLGCVFAIAGAAIMVASNTLVFRHHPEKLEEVYFPVNTASAAVRPPGSASATTVTGEDHEEQEEESRQSQGQEPRAPPDTMQPSTCSQRACKWLRNALMEQLVKQTTDAQLAIVLTEDLPQALLQSVFVFFFGGSLTQAAFIAISAGKIALCLSGRAAIARAAGMYGESYTAEERMARLLVACFQAVVGTRSPLTLSAMHGLASSIHSQGRYGEAEQLHQQGLELRVEVLGRSHPDTLASMHGLASSIYSQGRYGEAEQLNQQGLELYVEVLGRSHPVTLASMHNLASSIHSQGRYGEAEQLHQQVLELRVEVLGRSHPDTLGSMYNLALNINSQGRHREAEQLHQQVLELRVEMLGRSHPDTLGSMYNLALCIHSQGRHREAEQLHQQVLELRVEVLGRSHPDTLNSMHNLALSIDMQGRHREAEQLHQQVLELRVEVLGRSHPDTLMSMLNLALASMLNLATATREQVRDPDVELGASLP